MAEGIELQAEKQNNQSSIKEETGAADGVNRKRKFGEIEDDILKMDGEGVDAERFRRLLTHLSKPQLLDLVVKAYTTHEDTRAAAKQALEDCPAARRLMVRNISFQTDNQALHDAFAIFGSIEDYTIVRDRETKKSKGFGFVTFKSVYAVSKVLDTPIVVDGRQLQIKLAATDAANSPTGSPEKQATEDRKLFVRNLHDSITTERLRSIFEVYGSLEDCVVVRDSAGRSKGYGFVTFTNPKDAEKAVHTGQRVIEGQAVFLSYALPSGSSQGGAAKFQRTGGYNAVPHGYGAAPAVGAGAGGYMASYHGAQAAAYPPQQHFAPSPTAASPYYGYGTGGRTDADAYGAASPGGVGGGAPYDPTAMAGQAAVSMAAGHHHQGAHPGYGQGAGTGMMMRPHGGPFPSGAAAGGPSYGGSGAVPSAVGY